MAKITKFPVEKVYPSTVKGHEIAAQEQPPPEMVWAVCPWVKRPRNSEITRCLHCPRYIEDKDYGQMQLGCYGLAAEVCRVVFAMQKRGER